jgi:hypothetical protein
MTVLDERTQELNGRVLSDGEANLRASALPVPLEQLIGLMRRYPLIGMSFSLPPEDDLFGLGADLKWMAPEDIVGESSQFYPGISALRLGYVPIGSCLRGSGDPYFIRASLEDPPLLRVPHDCLCPDLSLPEGRVEIVRATLSDFFRVAQFG